MLCEVRVFRHWEVFEILFFHQYKNFDNEFNITCVWIQKLQNFSHFVPSKTYGIFPYLRTTTGWSSQWPSSRNFSQSHTDLLWECLRNRLLFNRICEKFGFFWEVNEDEKENVDICDNFNFWTPKMSSELMGVLDSIYEGSFVLYLTKGLNHKWTYF